MVSAHELRFLIPWFLIGGTLQDKSSQGSSMTYQLSISLQTFMPTLTIALYNPYSFKQVLTRFWYDLPIIRLFTKFYVYTNNCII
jgi:hypothetical protein